MSVELFQIAAGFIVVAVLVVVLARRYKNQPAANQPVPEVPEEEWKRLFAEAEGTVEKIKSSLPAEIAQPANTITIILERWSPNPGELGCFEGFEFAAVSDHGVMKIYVGEIHQFCSEEGESFEQQVKLTYLHELGHALGLDEGDLESRGLD